MSPHSLQKSKPPTMLQQSPHLGGGHRRLDDSATEPPMIGDYYPNYQGGFNNFQPSLAVVLGVLAVMFSLTFALLIYAKCCHRDPAATARRNRLRSSVFSSASIYSIRTSGLSKKAIESLPFFRFGTLRGSKDGLECAVCLSKYEDTEILRLLPKCRHAFHIDCVDRWLAGNSTCPLCRRNVAAEDASLLNTSSRFVPASSIQEDAEDPNLNPDMNSIDLNPNSIVNEGIEVFVEREEEEAGDQDRAVCRSASIFSIGSSFRRLFAGEGGIPVADAGSGGDKALHRHNHKIVVSDVVFKNRWSNVSSSDLMFLKSEMMFSSNQFSSSARSNRDRSAAAARSLGDVEIVQRIKDEIEKKRCLERRGIEFVKRDSNDSSSSPTRALLNPSSSGDSGGGGNSPTVEGRRSMSEITVFSRFRELGCRNYKGRENPVSDGVISGSGEEAVAEKKRKKWLPIARKTVEWLASREETQCSGNRQGLNFV